MFGLKMFQFLHFLGASLFLWNSISRILRPKSSWTFWANLFISLFLIIFSGLMLMYKMGIQYGQAIPLFIVLKFILLALLSALPFIAKKVQWGRHMSVVFFVLFSVVLYISFFKV